jgi:hypothetical protein
MAVRGVFELTGLTAYLEDLAAAEQDVDAVVAKTLEEAKPIAEEEMLHNLRASSEQWTGETAATLYSTDAHQEGNYVFIEFGADTQKDPAGYFKEYGTTRQSAEAFLRPALRSHRMKNALKAAMRSIVKRYGLLK